MRRLLIASALVLSSCLAPQTSSGVHIIEAIAPGPTCAFTDQTIYKIGGSLDMSANALYGAPRGYFQIFAWDNTMDPSSTVINGQTFNSPTNNDFWATQALMTYAGNGVNLPQQTFDLAAHISAGSFASGGAGSWSFGVNLFPGAAASLLDSQVTSTAGTDVVVTFHLTGYFGNSTPGRTSDFSFPIHVFRSGLTSCPGNLYLPGECGRIGKDAPVMCPPPGSDGGVYP